MARDLAVDVCFPHTVLHEVRVISNFSPLVTWRGLCVERSKNNAELWLERRRAVRQLYLDHKDRVRG